MHKPLNKVESKRIFREVISTLADYGVIPFLMFGTLLGYIRENGFIDGDDDIDLGIHACDTQKLISAFNYLVANFGAHYTPGNDGSSFIQMEYCEAAFSVSVFHYSRGFWRSGDWLLSDAEVNSLTTTEFNGKKIRGFPEDTAKDVLKRLYGEDWQTPVKNRKASWYEDRRGAEDVVADIYAGEKIIEYSFGSDILSQAKYIKVKHCPVDTAVRQNLNKFGFLCIGEQDGEMLFKNIRER